MPALSTIGLIAGAGMGAGKAAAGQARAGELTDLSAETARYSPWTGMDANAPLQQAQAQNTDVLGNMMQGGMSGAAFGQGVDANNIWNQIPKAELKMPEFKMPEAAPVGLQAPQLQEGQGMQGMADQYGMGLNPNRMNFAQGMRKPTLGF